MKKIRDFRVLHDGWEMDNAAWVTEDIAGKRKLETTSHGMKYEMSKEELFDKISETETSLLALKEAADLMGYNT